MIGRIHSLESFGTVDGPGIRFIAFIINFFHFNTFIKLYKPIY